MSDSSPLPPLPSRPADGHKGTFGTVAVIGGCDRSQDNHTRMIGGAALAVLSAMRTGCGLGILVMPEPVLNVGLELAPTATGMILDVGPGGELTPHLAAETIDRVISKADALVVGPALGDVSGVEAIVNRCVGQEQIPVVVDADGLSTLARTPNFWMDFKARAVLTPHPGEYRRLAQALGISADPVDESQRQMAAERLAQRLGCVAVLKGARTVVSDGVRTWVHAHPNPALATGGSGDVLSGVIASLLAQHAGRINGAPAVLDLYDAARLGVTAHAAAAGRWCARSGASGGMLASDLLDELPAAIESLRCGR